MRASPIGDIQGHAFSGSERLFVDTNVWLAVYGPLGYQHRQAKVYSGALRDMRMAGCKIHTDVLVLSEFINRYARWEHEQAGPHAGKFKRFRSTPAFRQICADIANQARRIVRQSTCCDSGFATADVEAILSEFETRQPDFNDQIIVGICLSNGFTLVTHDADFGQAGLPILTANSRLLAT